MSEIIYNNVWKKFQCSIWTKWKLLKIEWLIEVLSGLALLRYWEYNFYPVIKNISLEKNLIQNFKIIE